MIRIKLKTRRGAPKLKNGEVAPTRISVRKQPYLIGTGIDCQLRCQGDGVVEKQCVILVEDGRAWVENLNSEGGTLLNDSRIDERQLLLDRDMIGFGEFEFQVQISNVAAANEWRSKLANDDEDLENEIDEPPSNNVEADDAEHPNEFEADEADEVTENEIVVVDEIESADDAELNETDVVQLTLVCDESETSDNATTDG